MREWRKATKNVLSPRMFFCESLELDFDFSSLLEGEEPLLINAVSVEGNEVAGGQCSVERDDSYKRVEQSREQRKVVVINDAEFQKRNETTLPINTKTSTCWAVNTWSEWANELNWKSKEICATDKYLTMRS